MIAITLENTMSQLEGKLPPEIEQRISDTLCFVKQGCEHMEKVQSEEWDGVVRLYRKGEPFYTGLLGPLCQILKESNVEYKLFDKRLRTENNFPELNFCPPDWFQKRDYAEFTISRAIDKTRGILNIGTGGGKTFIVAELISRLKVKPFIFYTLTKDLLYQAKETLASCLNCKIGQVGDGVVDIADINVCTKDAVVYAINHRDKRFKVSDYKFDTEDVWDDSSLFGDSDCEKILDMVNNCRGIFFDECHHASSRTIIDLIKASPKAYWRYGGSATLEREDGEEILIQGLFGRRIVNITLSYLIKNKWLVPAGVFFVPISFTNVNFQSYAQIYSHCVIENDTVARFVGEFSQYLAGMGKSSLILVGKINHGKNLKKYMPEAEFLQGKDSSKKRKKIIEEMKSGKKKILIATTLADEGLDIPKLDFVHMVGSGASITRVPQRIGRVVRKYSGKKYGVAIYYHYCTQYLYNHGMKTKGIVKKEPELEMIQTADLDDLRAQVLDFMNRKESLFDL